MREVFEAVIEQALPVIAGFLVGLAAGIAGMWWIFL